MRTHQKRVVALACAAVAAFALSACGSDGGDSKQDGAAPGASPSAGGPSASPGSSAAPSAPATALSPLPESAEPSARYRKPVGDKRVVYLAGLKTVHPSLVADEEKALENGVQQCYTNMLPGIDTTAEAKKRFSTPEHPVSDFEAIMIEANVKSTICPY
ncbi:hypothetical protein [Streptomyces sp. NPDC048603]|uniref:hypothetical protein n=1 Tax=Streptomyces sp. NPDC048603 TaxID=3365577 RepID=UPI00371E72DC